jgi:thiamine pyrophosphate-dependent acetolactate synthase large subunit-like protein
MAAADMANVLRHAVGDRTVCLTHVSLSWHGEFWPFRHPLDYVGSDGGGGVGGGPGGSVGAALALKGSGRLPIAVCGDGDFMMGCGGGPRCITTFRCCLWWLTIARSTATRFTRNVSQHATGRSTASGSTSASRSDIDIAWSPGQGAKGFGPCGTGELEKALKEAIPRSRAAASPWSMPASSAAGLRRLRRWPAARPTMAPESERG